METIIEYVVKGFSVLLIVGILLLVKNIISYLNTKGFEINLDNAIKWIDATIDSVIDEFSKEPSVLTNTNVQNSISSVVIDKLEDTDKYNMFTETELKLMVTSRIKKKLGGYTDAA